MGVAVVAGHAQVALVVDDRLIAGAPHVLVVNRREHMRPGDGRQAGVGVALVAALRPETVVGGRNIVVIVHVAGDAVAVALIAEIDGAVRMHAAAGRDDVVLHQRGAGTGRVDVAGGAEVVEVVRRRRRRRCSRRNCSRRSATVKTTLRCRPVRRGWHGSSTCSRRRR